MPDLEKVIKALECCINAGDCQNQCDYWPDNRCEHLMMIDALELLKAQEPVKAYRLHGEKVIDNGEKVFTGQCTNCFCYLVDGWKACPVCGRAVKWDG